MNRKRKPYAFHFILFVAAGLTLSCGSPPRTREAVGAFAPQGLTCVAMIGGLDRISDIHITGLLKSHGIECLIEGSIFYGIAVPEKDAARSIAILTDDLKDHHYPIRIGGLDARWDCPLADADWIVTQPRQEHEDLIGLEQYRASTDLGAALRHEDVKDAVLAFPYVAKIKFLKREYIDRNTHPATGHEVEIELVASLDEKVGGKTCSFQVWDNGSRIQTQGGHEWWFGDPDTVTANQKKYDRRKK